MKTLVLGVGNTLIGDDGVGVYAARKLAGMISDEAIDVMDTAIDGLNLLDVIRSYERLIIIDALLDQQAETGTIFRMNQDDIDHMASSGAASHNLNLATTLKLGHKIFPGEIPGEVIIFAVVSENVDYVCESMTENVKQALPEVIDLVLDELGLKVA